MNEATKRLWTVKMLRLPQSADTQMHHLIDRIPPKIRSIILFTLLSLLTAFLVAPDGVTLFSALRQAVLSQIAGLTLLTGGIYFALLQASGRFATGTIRAQAAFRVMVVAILGQVVLIRLGLMVVTTLSEGRGNSNFGDPFVDQFAIPFAVCALVLTLLISSQVALICALIVAVFVGIMANGGVAISLFALTSSFAAVYKCEGYRTRNTITRATLYMALVNALMSFAALLTAGYELSWRVVFESSVAGIVGAFLTAGIASLVTPVYESAFSILTDMKLLELASTDHPLLRQLAIKTPGTHHHSFVVGTLAEAAAKAIGANALLARTGCLFHDVGKMAAPRMYIENQQGGENPHDKVAPADSVRIITGHVRRGIKMAQEAGLPQQIIDFIPQHHGTRTLSYFYHKARTQAEARGETINIHDFRYPGPKPQSKEAAILMLSDGAEASVRSLEDPTLENIELLLDKIINNVISDGQLDECHITLREIRTIKETLVKTLTGIYHQRISYPGFNPPANGTGNAEVSPTDTERDQSPIENRLEEKVSAETASQQASVGKN
jgi:putative nucleotidyltransferase with HDIG domain